jgi:hypothetical protein
MGSVLKGSYVSPGPVQLANLGAILNDIHNIYKFRRVVSKSNALAGDVRHALEVLQFFFDERTRACYPDGVMRVSLQLAESEARLRGKFYAFMDAMKAHAFELDMDMDADALMADLESRYDLVDSIASAFRIAMYQNNRGRAFGSSNDGPVARFVCAVIPHITGETPPTLGSVAQQLKRSRQKRQRTGTNDP